MSAIVDSISGIVSNSDGAKLIGLDDAAGVLGRDVERLAIKLITLYNPHSSAATFILRKRVLDENNEERFIKRFDDSIPATDSWVFGTLGGILILSDVEDWYELKLDSAPTQPIEYCVDFAVMI